MGFIRHAKRIVKPLLPRWLLRRLYGLSGAAELGLAGYEYHPDDTVVADFAEFASQPTSDIVAGIRKYRQLVQGEWKMLGASIFEEASRKFYAQSQTFAFDLLAGNYNRRVVLEKLEGFSPAIMSSIKQHPGLRFLEFGGGLGVFCEVVSELGKSVTYLDIPGRISEFATWRFQKRGIPVRTVIVEPGHLDGLEDYDIVFTDAVLEHLPPDEQRRVVRLLGSHVTAGGLLVLLVDMSGPTRANPTHEVVHIDVLHSILDECGLRCQDGRGKFWSIWRRGVAEAT
jgi:SAM-dependent methyltransferase